MFLDSAVLVDLLHSRKTYLFWRNAKEHKLSCLLPQRENYFTSLLLVQTWTDSIKPKEAELAPDII